MCRMSVKIAEFPSLSAAENSSITAIHRMRDIVASIPTVVPGFMDVIVVGSYGRGEAAPGVSDVEWITIFDDRHVAREEGLVAQADLTRRFADEFGRESLSISKTFGEVAARSSLVTNIGGEADTNQTLTYRMLTLAEGRTLTDDAHAKVVSALAQTYGGTHTAGHRLLSLATEVARYWRTLRIDYKFKVDETKKPWALRSIKLRSFRRFWYFSSALHFIASGPRVNQPGRLAPPAVEQFMKTMGGNPAIRFIDAAALLGVEEELVRRILRTYDQIHQRASDPSVRQTLDEVVAEKMEESPVIVEIREMTRDLHRSMAELVLKLPEKHLQELLEMFLL